MYVQNLFSKNWLLAKGELQIGNTKIKQTRWKYQGSILTEYGMCYIDIRMRIGIAKEAF